MKHVILGAGPAGVIAAETIRKHAPNDSITIVGDEPEAPYSRMAIPYLLIGNIQEAGTELRHGADHFARQRIEVMRGIRAESVNTQAQTIKLSDGRVLPYDRLLVATGSRPASPPIAGIHSAGVHSCWTLADARAIMALAKPGARVVQMGAGFIGCIIMEALAMRGVQLSVVEMGDRMVPRMMGPTAGGMIKDWCERKGVKVYTGARVESIGAAGASSAAARPSASSATAAEPGFFGKIAALLGFGDAPGAAAAPAAHAAGGGTGLAVRLSTGQTLQADLVISATGVKPNVDFLQGSGVVIKTGIVTDARMATNVAHVYAAGDCAEAFDQASGTHVVSAIQPNAADEARIAALNMVGQAASLQRVPQINVLDTLGLISASFGQWQGVPGGEHVELTDRAADRHLSLQFSGDRLVGCNSIGWTDHVGVMRGLVEGEVSLGPWKQTLLKDPTKLMEAYLDRAQGAATHALVKA
ncbi:MAG: NAD(P)/FAD-dependent oxidoreductase [Betaproteobacteria bacterium]|nr:NAD(P)/FAD-dependent oxidoreductase [Betaproteobacteria bacterium]NBX96801.1 NAD(P)/FAD-dependent oxidoreductase [Betaproteobacteria bacterium]